MTCRPCERYQTIKPRPYDHEKQPRSAPVLVTARKTLHSARADYPAAQQCCVVPDSHQPCPRCLRPACHSQIDTPSATATTTPPPSSSFSSTEAHRRPCHKGHCTAAILDTRRPRERGRRGHDQDPARLKLASKAAQDVRSCRNPRRQLPTAPSHAKYRKASLQDAGAGSSGRRVVTQCGRQQQRW